MKLSFPAVAALAVLPFVAVADVQAQEPGRAVARVDALAAAALEPAHQRVDAPARDEPGATVVPVVGRTVDHERSDAVVLLTEPGRDGRGPCWRRPASPG